MNKYKEMKISIGYILFSLLFICLLNSCSEFIEESVEDEKVFLNAPSDSTESSKYLQGFWWEPVDNALSYRLQIASPSFDHPAELLLDTLVKDTRFSFTLEPGEFEWRVRAENGSSTSFYSTRSLIIYESSLSKQQVQLKTPGNGLLVNLPDITFSWYKMYGAKSYILQVDSSGNSFADEAKLLLNTETSNLTASIKLGSDKNLQWRVRAKNDSTESKWSVINSCGYDGTPPVKVNLTSPSKAAYVSNPVSLQWGSIADAKRYQLYVLKSDSTAYNSSFPVLVNTNSYSFSGTAGETVLWKVRAIDAAGNTGEYSEIRSFSIQ